MGQQEQPQTQQAKPAGPEAQQREIDKLFTASMKTGASDLHLKVGSPPLFRIHGQVVRAKLPPLTLNHIKQLVGDIMGPKEVQALEDVGAADFAHGVKGVGRFRVNVFKQRGAISMAARRVQTDIPTIEQLNLPDGVKIIPTFEQGLCVVAGVTGSGKSTTLASLIEIMNQTQSLHIITIENPIEYLYRDSKSFINQREIGLDCVSFYDGLKYAVRQDPDVILVGEMRDEDTVETALMAAETGHVVFGTVHASNAAGTIGRILDFFPPTKHHQVRQLLFFNLKSIIVQKLLRGARPDVPRVPAVELMLVNPMIKKLIFEGEDNKIPDVIRASREEGMQDINQSLMDLVFRGLITEQVALESSPNPEQLAMNLKGITLGSDRGSLVS